MTPRFYDVNFFAFELNLSAGIRLEQGETWPTNAMQFSVRNL